MTAGLSLVIVEVTTDEELQEPASPWGQWACTFGEAFTEGKARHILKCALELFAPPEWNAPRGRETTLSVLLTDNRGIRPLNRQWRGKDHPTDVLSFPQPAGPLDPAGLTEEGRHLGDVVISLESAWNQADEHDLTPAEEVHFLLIHAVLHLLGHDHEEEEERRRMEACEQEIWTKTGGEGRVR